MTTSSIKEVVLSAVKPYDQTPSRFDLDGPDILTSARDALAFVLAINELCTNAMKYGALSNEGGVVDFTWGVSDGALEMHWRESGGPKVESPKARGYGSRMIERALAHDLQGTAKLDFQPEGVVCTISAPLEF